jgi:RHS repeat-associated protein
VQLVSRLEPVSYDAWGKRRLPNGVDDTAGVLTNQTSRGFTGHEELDQVGLVHMNGRVYDPLLARFGTPDPTTESPFSTQGWNRYSYVGNSPLNFTDPSGYCFLGCFWKPIFSAIQNLFKNIPILGTIVQIAAGALCGPLAAVCVGVAAAAITGITSGNLGLALKAGFISAVTAFAFYEVGNLTAHGTLAFGSETHLLNVAGHALVGCGSAVASGGKCGPGALSGAIGSFAGPLLTGLDSTSKLVATSALGGLASVAGGGKFANGALTAAFGYLFNEAMQPGCNRFGSVCGGGGAPGGGGMGAGPGVGAALGTGALLSGDTQQDQSEHTFYHGTDIESAVALLNGAPLSVDTALAQKYDGPLGFFLATALGDAEYFALRREPGGVIQYQMTTGALSTLLGSGATLGPIPVGPNSPYFTGSELFIPPQSFGTFDMLRTRGDIRVTPIK